LLERDAMSLTKTSEVAWEIVAIRHDREKLLADLQIGETKRTVYMTAGILAAMGLLGAPLYDGKAKP
jgi:hypothetical protein